MNKHGYLLGSDGKINPKGSCTREMAVIVANRIYNKYVLGISNVVKKENNWVGVYDEYYSHAEKKLSKDFYKNEIYIPYIELFKDGTYKFNLNVFVGIEGNEVDR